MPPAQTRRLKRVPGRHHRPPGSPPSLPCPALLLPLHHPTLARRSPVNNLPAIALPPAPPPLENSPWLWQCTSQTRRQKWSEPACSSPDLTWIHPPGVTLFASPPYGFGRSIRGLAHFEVGWVGVWFVSVVGFYSGSDLGEMRCGAGW